MINKTLVFLVATLILIIGLMTILNFDQGTDSVTIIDGDNTVTDDDVINEIDENLIDADSEIDIGEMI